VGLAQIEFKNQHGLKYYFSVENRQNYDENLLLQADPPLLKVGHPTVYVYLKTLDLTL
jgi:hypothetical protein